MVGKGNKTFIKSTFSFHALFSYSRLFRAKGLYDKKIQVCDNQQKVIDFRYLLITYSICILGSVF